MSNYETMPKVELHVHLEGAIPLEAMWTLVEASGDRAGLTSIYDLRERFRYRDFSHFIETWVWKNRFLDSYEAFTFVAEAFAADLARQNIVYAEAYFSPADFAGQGLETAPLAVAIRKGLDRVAGTSVALIVDFVRDLGPERAERTFDQIREAADEAGVIGVTIGGSEAEFPPELFAGVFGRAQRAGFHLTAHAGEAAGPESVRGALSALGVERIGHGVRSVEDDDLVDLLVERQVPLEICPTSNLRTVVVSGWEDHPVRRLIERGAMVTLNSDDPAMFDCTLAGEYREVATRFGFDGSVMRRVALNAVDGSWAGPAEKDRLRRLIGEWWADSESL